MPLELIDVEVLLDGEHGVLHLLRFADCDVRPFVSTLSREFGLHILSRTSAGPAASLTEEEEHAGCGARAAAAGGGGCSSCGTRRLRFLRDERTSKKPSPACARRWNGRTALL